MKIKKHKKKKKKTGCFIMIILTIIIACLTANFIDGLTPNYAKIKPLSTEEVNKKVEKFVKRNDLQTDEYPPELLELMEKNPETEDFVLNYPLKKDDEPKIDLSEYENSSKVPLLMQWDERWGYYKYGNKVMGLSGCGPTCLSMVAIYLLNDEKYDPKYMAEFAENNGYCDSQNGSSWSLISEGGEKLGLDVVEIPLDESRIRKNLEVGNPIICVMGPGDFTSSGHFIVLTKYTDGKVKVNDPNSKANSEKLWELDKIKYQIRNLWVLRK